jgi:hypothetical protein
MANLSIGKPLWQVIVLNIGEVQLPWPLQLALPSPYIDDGRGIGQ